MILSSQKIKNLITNDANSLINGYKESNLQAASYDITSDNIVVSFSSLPAVLSLNENINIEEFYNKANIDNGYKMMPGEYVLIKVKESFNLPRNVVAHIRPRTTYTRLGLLLCDQHINPTFQGTLYLGMFNATTRVVELYPNLIIGQIVFEEIDGDIPDELLYKNKKNAKYQNEDEFLPPNISEDIQAFYRKALAEAMGK